MPIPMKYRTMDEWYELIQECRRSGLSDAQWCREHDISRNTFNGAIKRLRKCSHAVPQCRHHDGLSDLTVASQDVVRINLIPDEGPKAEVTPQATTHLDNSRTIEISVGPAVVRVSNDADPLLLAQVLRILGGQS